MVLGKNKRTSPRGVWGDVRTAQVIGLPGVHNAPCRSVSASAHEDRVLTQARGAEPYRGMLRVGARCCSCWEHRPGGRTFSADPALACRRSLPPGLLRSPAHRKGTGPGTSPEGWPVISRLPTAALPGWRSLALDAYGAPARRTKHCRASTPGRRRDGRGRRDVLGLQVRPDRACSGGARPRR